MDHYLNNLYIYSGLYIPGLHFLILILASTQFKLGLATIYNTFIYKCANEIDLIADTPAFLIQLA